MPTYSTTDYAEGTSVTQSFPFGFLCKARVMCSDGKVRATKWMAASADTFFSHPCHVKVNGRHVSGYLTIECVSGSSVATDDDPLMVKFVAYTYTKNADALPPGAWKVEP